MRSKLTALFVFVAIFTTVAVFNFANFKEYFSSNKDQVSIPPKELTINDIQNRLISSKFVDYETKNVSVISNQVANKKVIYVHLWASWCGPCLNEIPELVRYAKAHNDEAQFILVSLDDAKDDLTKFLKSFPEMNDPMFVKIWDQDKSLSKFFDVDRLPMTIVLDLTENKVKPIRSVIDWKSL